MVSVLISFSRITILSFVLVFTLLDLVLLFEAKLGEGVVQVLSTIQIMMVVLFLLNGSVVLYFATENMQIIFLMVLQFILFIAINVSVSKLSYTYSRTLNNNILMLLSFSFIFLERLSINTAVKQLLFAIISVSIACAVVLVLRETKHIQRQMFIFAAIGIVLLLAVSLAGQVEYGAKLSFTIGQFRVQPSEFVKLLYLFFVSGCIVVYKDIRGFIFASVGAAIHVLILVYSRDLGTGLIFLATYLLLIFIAYKNYIVLVLELVIATLGGIFAFNYFPHIQSRFVAWLDPLSDVENRGYQISQSLFAIGTGGWFGSGLTNGMPTKIPVVTNDFIFAAISEELGALVGVCLILILMCTSVAIFNLAFTCSNSFYMLVTSGIAIIFSIQTILNIGGVIKFIPSTGVTLPFVSSGGSSLLSMFICIYIAQCSDDLIYINKGRRDYV
ncbi:MAG: FtsW/RodA/SpoVE family cell cycle protein [Pseudobutyrivibrio sp.]|nr:FtsW/RodA/SpoVE family cell cycle protein [Pseudobutyrivibrio sp.]